MNSKVPQDALRLKLRILPDIHPGKSTAGISFPSYPNIDRFHEFWRC